MRVDPMMQLNEAITAFIEAIAYPSMLAMALALLVLSSIELRSRIRRQGPTSNEGDRATARDPDGRRRSGRVAPAAR